MNQMVLSSTPCKVRRAPPIRSDAFFSVTTAPCAPLRPGSPTSSSPCGRFVRLCLEVGKIQVKLPRQNSGSAFGIGLNLHENFVDTDLENYGEFDVRPRGGGGPNPMCAPSGRPPLPLTHTFTQHSKCTSHTPNSIDTHVNAQHIQCTFAHTPPPY